MSEDDLPRTVIVLLAAFSVVSFAVGSTLEMMRPDVLFRHPYWVNLLSGMTGFTTSGFIISVLFRRIQRRHQRRTFAGRAGPEINQIAEEAVSCMWVVFSELDDEADHDSLEDVSAVVREVKQRINDVDEIGGLVVLFLRGIHGAGNQPVRRDAILFGRYESMSAKVLATPTQEIPLEVRDEIHQRIGALVTLAEGSRLPEMTERSNCRMVLAQLRREAAAWRDDPDVHQMMQSTLGRLRELMIGGAHRDFMSEIGVALKTYEDVAIRPVSIIRLLVTLMVTALEVTSSDRFPKDILREFGLD